MTDANKTRDKLVDSMRKTKAGTVGQQASEQAGDTAAEKPAAPKARSGGQTRKRAAATKPTPAPARARVQIDPYQGGTRIWPD